jgi:hypothetical protein
VKPCITVTTFPDFTAGFPASGSFGFVCVHAGHPPHPWSDLSKVCNVWEVRRLAYSIPEMDTHFLDAPDCTRRIPQYDRVAHCRRQFTPFLCICHCQWEVLSCQDTRGPLPTACGLVTGPDSKAMQHVMLHEDQPCLHPETDCNITRGSENVSIQHSRVKTHISQMYLMNFCMRL